MAAMLAADMVAHQHMALRVHSAGTATGGVSELSTPAAVPAAVAHLKWAQGSLGTRWDAHASGKRVLETLDLIVFARRRLVVIADLPTRVHRGRDMRTLMHKVVFSAHRRERRGSSQLL